MDLTNLTKKKIIKIGPLEAKIEGFQVDDLEENFKTICLKKMAPTVPTHNSNNLSS